SSACEESSSTSGIAAAIDGDFFVPKDEKRFLFCWERVKGFQEPSAHPLFPFRQHVEFGGLAGFLQDPAAFIVFRHRNQDRLKAVGQRRGQILSDRNQVAWEPLHLRQNPDLRFCLVVERGVVVVAKRSGRRLIRQNQVYELLLRQGKNVTNLLRRHARVQPAF